MSDSIQFRRVEGLRRDRPKERSAERTKSVHELRLDIRKDEIDSDLLGAFLTPNAIGRDLAAHDAKTANAITIPKIMILTRMRPITIAATVFQKESF